MITSCVVSTAESVHNVEVNERNVVEIFELQMVEKYRMEARAAQELHTAPLSSQVKEDLVSHNIIGDQNAEQGAEPAEETLPVNCKSESHNQSTRKPAEEGITEVGLPNLLEDTSQPQTLSPLTTASR